MAAWRILGGALAMALAGGALEPGFVHGQSPIDPENLEILPAKKANKLILRQPPPEYPTIAKMNYIEGEVRVQAIVVSGGEVAEAHVVKGHPFLAVAALKAIRNWLFKPAQSRPGPAAFQTMVDVKFHLHSRKLRMWPDKPERDLDRQIRPPELLEKRGNTDTAEKVKMRILVSEEGLVLDAQPLLPSANHLREARRIVASWSFRPAYWGAMAVPWYLDVEVPVETWPAAQGGTNPDGR